MEVAELSGPGIDFRYVRPETVSNAALASRAGNLQALQVPTPLLTTGFYSTGTYITSTCRSIFM
jgi:hypothetical protein